MASVKKAYAPIDIRKPAPGTWPAIVPPLTPGGAINAAKRLYRFAMGEKFEGDVVLASGNRRAIWFYWDEQGSMFFRVNPSQGWRDFVHDASHMLDYLANGESSHSKHHARFEAKLVAQVVKRGWLEPKAPKPAPVIDETPPPDPRIEKIARLDARLASWERKRKRAERAMVKINRSRSATLRAMERAKSH